MARAREVSDSGGMCRAGRANNIVTSVLGWRTTLPPPAGTQGRWLRSRQPGAPTSALDMAAESPLDEVLLDALPRSSKNILLENVAVEPVSAATATTSV